MSEQHTLTTDYLQLSPNITGCFRPPKLPVNLYSYDERLNRIVEIISSNKPFNFKKREYALEVSSTGNLFLSRSEYSLFADHLNTDLGWLLTEDLLSYKDTVPIIYQSIHNLIKDFFANPVKKCLEPLYDPLAILCEFIWANPEVHPAFYNTLKTANSLLNHSINVLLIGLPLYLSIQPTKPEKKVLNNAAIALILHDIGMTKINPSLLAKKEKLTFKEKSSVMSHIKIGERILNRLYINEQEIRICLTQHHERIDGSGYPEGKRLKDLHPLAQVCGVCDSFCAMIAERPHTRSMSPLTAALVLMDNKKTYPNKICKKILKNLVRSKPEYQEILNDKNRLSMLIKTARKNEEIYKF